VIENAHNLCSLRLHVIWLPDTPSFVSEWAEDHEDHEVDGWKLWKSEKHGVEKFTVAEAMEIMLSNNPRIRLIEMGADVYTVRLPSSHLNSIPQLIVDTGPLGTQTWS
jgi:hypothetical protein